MNDKKHQVEPYGASTVAMSVYNLLALKGRPVEAAELLADLQALQLPELGDELFTKALAQAEARGLVRGREGLFWIKDPRRRRITSRDRSDGHVDEATGEVLGGWGGWCVEDPHGPVPIEEVI